MGQQHQGQSGPESNGIEGVTSHSLQLFLAGGLTPLQGIESLYSDPLLTGQRRQRDLKREKVRLRRKGG